MKISQALGRLFLPHQKWLRDYELIVFTVFYEHLEAEHQKAFLKQLEYRDVLERSPSGKLLMFGDASGQAFNDYRDEVRLPLHSNPRPYPGSDSDDPANYFQGDSYKFKVLQKNNVWLSFVLTTIQGIIREIQFIKHPKTFGKKSVKYRNLNKYFSDKYSGIPREITFTFEGFTGKDEDEMLENKSFKG